MAAPIVYASVDELKVAIGMPAGETADDAPFLRCLEAASRQIDGEVTRRSLGTVTGFSEAAPAPIREACKLIAVALYKRPQAPFGVLESSLDGTPIQVGRDFHVDALITSVVPWNSAAI